MSKQKTLFHVFCFINGYFKLYTQLHIMLVIFKIQIIFKLMFNIGISTVDDVI